MALYLKLDPPYIAVLDTTDYGETTCINRVNVPALYRGRRLGSALLYQACLLADRQRVTLSLDVYASGLLTNGLSKVHLIAWYKRYGFELLYDDHMERRPRPDDGRRDYEWNGQRVAGTIDVAMQCRSQWVAKTPQNEEIRVNPGTDPKTP